MESRWPHVRQLTLYRSDSDNWPPPLPASEPIKLTQDFFNSYNRYLAVAARVVRRSLKEDKRIVAERRGEMDLRFVKWEVRRGRSSHVG